MKYFIHTLVLSVIVMSPLQAACETPTDSETTEPSPEDIATAREQFRTAAQKAREGKWNEALTAYEKSMALRPSPLTRYSIAIAQQHVGKWVESMENLRTFLQQKRSAKMLPYFGPARQALKEAERKVARLKIMVPGNPRHIRIRIDHKRVSSAVVGIDRIINPGPHLVEVRVPGQDHFRKKVTLAPGGKAQVVARFRIVPNQTEDFDDDYDGSYSCRGSSWVATATLIGGGVVFATGATFGVLGYSEANLVTVSNDEHARKARTFALVGDISMGAGLALAGVGTYLLLSDSDCQKPAATTTAMRVSPWMDGHTGGLSVSGLF